jgi:lipopolysaccharide transport system ATP-binding protein
MDEVLAVGDLAFQKKCLDKMRNVANKEGRTVLYVSHNMNTIRQLCDRCIVLDQGRIVFNGDVEKAIEIYSATNSSEYSVDINLSEKRMDHLPKEYKAKMTRIKLAEKELPLYEFGEKIDFELEIEAKEKITNLCIRMEVRSIDGGSVGAAVLQNFVSMEPNQVQTFSFTFDSSSIVPGRYNVLAVLYCVNEFGAYEDLDAIYPTFSFDIQDSFGKIGIHWNSNHWGKVKFSDIEFGGIK